MKILLVTHLIPYPPTGGVALRNYNLLKETSANNEVFLLTFYQRAHHKDQAAVERGIEGIRELCKHLEVFEIPTDRNKPAWYLLLLANLFSLSPYSPWRYYSAKMVKAIERLLEEHTFDVMEIGTIALANYGKLAPSVPKVLVHHNIESQLLYRRSKYVKNWFAKAYLSLQARKLKRFERRVSEFIDSHTTCSVEDKKTFLRIADKAQVEVVPNGVDTEYFANTGDQEEPDNLIYVGGMTWYPNYDAMLYFIDDILPLVKEEIPEIRLTHIGRQTGDEFSRMAEKNKALEFLGFVDDIRPEMSKAAVYIVPLRIGGGTRLKILDAMSMGCAIVSTSVGCEGIEVTDGKDIIIADEADAFARKIIQMVRDPNMRRSLRDNARKTAVDKYSWKKIAPRLEDVYRKLASPDTGRD